MEAAEKPNAKGKGFFHMARFYAVAGRSTVLSYEVYSSIRNR
jgi:hypothetical protein